MGHSVAVRAKPDFNLTSGRADVWLFDLSNLDRQISQREVHLSRGEAARCRNMTARRRQEFIAGRGVLRTILSVYLNRPSSKIAFTIGQHGKPYLTDVNCNMHFNLAHSGQYTLCAVTQVGPIGVDIEIERTVSNNFSLARELFGDGAAKALATLPDDARARALLQAWVRKEAVLKGEGLDVAKSQADFRVTWSLDESPRVIAWKGVQLCGASWTLFDLELPAPLVGAVAVRGRVTELRLFRYPVELGLDVRALRKEGLISL